MNKRIEWIDICKSFTMILVIYLHFGAPGIIDGYIHLFHMPIFFFLSGLCFDEEKNSDFFQFARKRVKSILIPYFGFSFVFYIFWSAIYFIKSNSPVPAESFIKSLLWSNTTAIPKLVGGVQWFLTSLFVVELLYFALYRIAKKKVYVFSISMIISFFTIYCVSRYTIPRFPLAVDTALVALMFYATGNLFRNKLLQDMGQIKDRWIIALVTSFFISIVVFALIGKTNVRKMKFGNNPLLYYIGAMAGIAMLCGVSKKVSDFSLPDKVQKWFSYFGKNTIIVLYTHRLFIGLCNMILGDMGIVLSTYVRLVYSIFLVIVFLLIANYISFAVNTYFPVLVGKTKGHNNT